MQSNGRVHILLAGIGILVIGIIWFLLVTGVFTSTDPVSTNTPISVATSQQQVTAFENNTPVAPTVLVNTRAGEPFSTRNFLNGAQVEQVDEDIFLISQASGLDGELYQIFFNRGGSINISLQDTNLSFSRLQAESALRELIPESDMRLCSLVVSVTVPSWLSQQLAVDHSGIDYGLSFCPGAQAII